MSKITTTMKVGVAAALIGTAVGFGAYWAVESWLGFGPFSHWWYIAAGAVMAGEVYGDMVKDVASEKIANSDKL